MLSPHPGKSAESPAKQTIHYDLSDMKPWREYQVILFNDEEHSFQEVEIQLMLALRCHPSRAQTLAIQVDQNGCAVVALADRLRALRIAAVLRQINLRVALWQIN